MRMLGRVLVTIRGPVRTSTLAERSAASSSAVIRCYHKLSNDGIDRVPSEPPIPFVYTFSDSFLGRLSSVVEAKKVRRLRVEECMWKRLTLSPATLAWRSARTRTEKVIIAPITSFGG